MNTATYHNHSNWSDGCGTLEDMVQTAQKKNLKSYGFSDHWVVCPNGAIPDWSIPSADALSQYMDEALRLKNAYSTDDFKVLIGLEVDFFQENADDILASLKKFPLDYLIGAIHYVGDFSVDNAAEDWAPLTPAQRDEVFHGYWAKMLKLCQFGKYDIVAHLDLPKKFGYRPSYDDTAEITAVLQALAASGMKMELNTAGLDKPCREGYPRAAILTRAHQMGIPMVLSSDSHAPEQIGRHFDEGYALLQHIMA